MPRHHHIAAKLAEHAFSDQLIDRVVLDQQHLAPTRGRRGVRLRFGEGGDLRLQNPSQMLVQRVARQRPGLLLQGGEGGGFFAGQKTAISSHQQNRRGDARAQTEQAFRTIGDQHIRIQAQQRIIDGALRVFQAPDRQQAFQQFRQATAGCSNGEDLAT